MKSATPILLCVTSAFFACAPPAAVKGEPAAPPARQGMPVTVGPDTTRSAPPATPLDATAGPPIPPDDRTRIAEAFRLADAIGDRIWPGWSSVPFALLLVTPGHEYLIRHSRPPADFVRGGYDSLLQSEVLARPRTFETRLLATFPIEGTPTVVIGQASVTGKHSTAWVATALHEHFHQLQMSQPGYNRDVEELRLARGDQSGMWMLNYAFPYGADSVQAAFSEMTLAMDSALSPAASSDRQARLRALTEPRSRLRRVLSADDDRYLSFQMWQEGVARYTELQVARWAAEHHVPSAAFAALADVLSFTVVADSIAAGIQRGLRANPLSNAGRVAFYPAGAATALLLDDVAPGWRTRYLESAFSLDALAGLPTDSAFAAVQDRGAAVMGVDQYTSTHVFEDLPDGGRIIFERQDASDSSGIAVIRAHMREIASAFARGDFTAPGLVHARDVPGTRVMITRRNAIAYRAVDRPRGAEVRITTTDTTALAAVREFLAFQRMDHRAAGHEGHGSHSP